MSDPLFRIKHPTLGYFENITRTQYDASKYFETWTHDAAKATAYTAEKLPQPMDANGYGLFKLLVCGYGGLKLEEAEYRARKKAPFCPENEEASAPLLNPKPFSEPRSAFQKVKKIMQGE